MAIQPKIASATILPTHRIQYNPATFSEHTFGRFHEATAEEVLDCIRPVTFDFLPGQKIIGYDTETFYTGVPANRMPSNVVRRFLQRGNKDIPQDLPFCMSFSDGTNSWAVYDTLENKFAEFKKLQPLLIDSSITKTGQNVDFDLHMTANCGVNIKGKLIDTMHIDKLVNANAFSHNLYDISKRLQNLNDSSPNYCPTILMYEDMLISYKEQHRITDYRQFPRDLMTHYTCADTWNTIWCLKNLFPKIHEYELLPLFEVESEMILVAYHMERRGVPVDPAYEHILIPELEAEVNEAERKIYDAAGSIFNINSAQQIYSIMQKLGYSHLVHFTKPTEAMLLKGQTKGNPSFDKIEMERLENEGVPLIADIVQFRKSEKLLNTFARKLYYMRDFNNILHCSINTMEAKTGRFSISQPSMQNMPRRKDSRVRGAFVAREGYVLYDTDFKAQESLIMAHYSRAPYLLDIINSGGDIHRAVAAVVYDILLEEVTKALREVAKSVEFAIVYGAGAPKVVSMVSDVEIKPGKKGMTLEEATLAIKTFKKRVPEVEVFIKTANQTIKERGCIRTVMGRRVYAERGREYACVNYLCQGSGADSTKTRMIEIHKFLQANELKTRMILQVHDSLLNEVHETEEHIVPWILWLQEERKLFRVNIVVEADKCYPTWRDKKGTGLKAIKPPQEMLDKLEAYDIWEEGIL